MIQVLIAEDHQMVRAGLRALLEKAGDVFVLGEASNGQEAIELTEQLNPDVLIMDIMMPRLNGIQAAEQLKSRKNNGTRILLLSMYSDESLVYQALQSGVNGSLLKTSASDELVQAVHEVAAGRRFLSSPISEIVMENAFKPRPTSELDPLANLSPREKEILQLIVEEHTSAEIAQLLTISEKTVEKHRANMMEKLHVRNLAGLVRLAVKYRVVDPDS